MRQSKAGKFCCCTKGRGGKGRLCLTLFDFVRPIRHSIRSVVGFSLDLPIGSPVSMSLPESARFSPFSSFAFLAVPGAYPYLTAKSIMAVPVHTATLVGEPMKPPEFKCSDNQSALIMREEEKRLRDTRET